MRTKPVKLLPALEQKYKKLSEVYLSRYEDQKDRHIKMMIAKGVLVDMESDLVFFHVKNTPTDRSILQQERLDILRNIIDEFASIHAFNFQVNMVLGDFYRENTQLKAEVAELKLEIDNHRKAMEGL